MKKVAVLLDGGFVLKKLYPLLGNNHATADNVCAFALACMNSDEELFRIYYYDCLPFEGARQNPISRADVDFSATPVCRARKAFLDSLALKDGVAFRRGQLSFDGWKLKFDAVNDLIQNPRPIVAGDFEPNFQQKRVDIKIGLDVAWLASKRIVDRLILVIADSDFVPAMKFARQEGVQVVLVPMGHAQLKREVREHADETRSVTFPPLVTP